MVGVYPAANGTFGQCADAEIIDLCFVGDVDNIESHCVASRARPVITEFKLGLISACNIDICADGDRFSRINKAGALHTGRERKAAVGIGDGRCAAHHKFVNRCRKFPAAEVGC